MDLATAAMGSLLPKLFELLQGEYKLQKGVKKDVEFLQKEMGSIDAALRKVAMVPRDQLHENSKIWANDVRELAYEMEDVVERFMVDVQGFEPAASQDSFKGFVKKVSNLFTKGKTRHQIANAIKSIKDQVQDVVDRRDRYKIDEVEARLAATTIVDPRLMAQFKDHKELVGIEEPRDELIKRLIDGDDCVSKQQLKILSIFGFGGLGKTTLARAVYDKIQAEFVCKAFVSVGQKPNLKNVLIGILLRIDEASCDNASLLDEVLLIEKLRELLTNKSHINRYLIIIDDIWDMGSWDIIKCAFTDSKCGSRVITTTRIFEVAKDSTDIYKQEPLSPGRSKELFCMRLSIGKSKSPYHESVKISDKILQKCGGIPLAIITIGSLLASKPVTDWPGVYDSIGFGNEDNKEVDTTRKILLYSYYDLPYYSRLCLLQLGIYPEDYEIKKDTLIWKWVAEGYVHEEPGKGLFEVGERYFNMLIDRSMIQAVEKPYRSIIYACRVHDLVLDMIHFLSEDESSVTASNSNRTSPRITARRLAINNEVVEQDGSVANTSMQQVRLYSATMCQFSMLPLLSHFKALRVLALEECTFVRSEQFSMKPEDSPYHLSISDQFFSWGIETPILEVPEEIGDLRFLQVLDLGRIDIEKLPQSVGRLTQLKCLRFGGSSMGVLDWTNLTSVEALQWDDVSPDFLNELGKLKELRELNLVFEEEHDNMLFKDLMGRLVNLQKLQVISVGGGWDRGPWSDYAGSVALGHLRHLELYFLLPGLPVWINSSCLPNLCHLRMELTATDSQDMEILGRFSELITLRIHCLDGVVFPDTMEEGAFTKLRYLELRESNQPRFVRGAMSSLEYFQFTGLVRANGLDFHSLVNLPRLEIVDAAIEGSTATGIDVVQAHASLKHAVEIHPNHPELIAN